MIRIRGADQHSRHFSTRSILSYTSGVMCIMQGTTLNRHCNGTGAIIIHCIPCEVSLSIVHVYVHCDRKANILKVGMCKGGHMGIYVHIDGVSWCLKWTCITLNCM